MIITMITIIVIFMTTTTTNNNNNDNDQTNYIDNKRTQVAVAEIRGSTCPGNRVVFPSEHSLGHP